MRAQKQGDIKLGGSQRSVEIGQNTESKFPGRDTQASRTRVPTPKAGTLAATDCCLDLSTAVPEVTSTLVPRAAGLICHPPYKPLSLKGPGLSTLGLLLTYSYYFQLSGAKGPQPVHW
jgi:hypothetical protein